MNKEYAKNIRFRGEGESNKDAERRIKRMKKLLEKNKFFTSMADIVRVSVDHMLGIEGVN